MLFASSLVCVRNDPSVPGQLVACDDVIEPTDTGVSAVLRSLGGNVPFADFFLCLLTVLIGVSFEISANDKGLVLWSIIGIVIGRWDGYLPRCDFQCQMNIATIRPCGSQSGLESHGRRIGRNPQRFFFCRNILYQQACRLLREKINTRHDSGYYFTTSTQPIDTDPSRNSIRLWGASKKVLFFICDASP
jgi:hypothetical protein